MAADQEIEANVTSSRDRVSGKNNPGPIRVFNRKNENRNLDRFDSKVSESIRRTRNRFQAINVDIRMEKSSKQELVILSGNV